MMVEVDIYRGLETTAREPGHTIKEKEMVITEEGTYFT